MENILLSLSCGAYDRTQPLVNKVVRPKNIDLECILLEPNEIFKRMLIGEEFDVSEMSLSNYMMERNQGNNRFTAIPVFLSRIFRHSNIYVNKNSQIKSPIDLKGKKVGLSEYHTTAALWLRGILSDEYGVKSSDIKWFTGGIEKPNSSDRIKSFIPPNGVHIEKIDDNKCLNDMLYHGEIDALINPSKPSCFENENIDRLWTNYREIEEDYFRRTSFFPIMHVVVIKSGILEKYPWVAQSLYDAFCHAKDLSLQNLTKKGTLPVMLPWAFDEVERIQKLMGDDFWAYGLNANSNILETMIRYSIEQGLCTKPMSLEDLFPLSIS